VTPALPYGYASVQGAKHLEGETSGLDVKRRGGEGAKRQRGEIVPIVAVHLH